MIYKNLYSLSVAVCDVDFADRVAVSNLSRLVSVYYDALNNPPEGVIGVGAITYAEQKLIEAQGDW